MSYYNNINTTILNLMSKDSERVCEFGCGAGALAREFKKVAPNVFYVGVELENEQLEQGRDVLDMSIQANLDDKSIWSGSENFNKIIKENSFDHIIFGDVLEHLNDPQSVLNNSVTKLKKHGSAIVCIPNVQHWSVFAQLILGSWPQLDSGLFDRTHIRWFTLNDMLLLIRNSGLEVESIHPRVFPSDQGLSILEDLEILAENLGVNPNEIIEKGQVLQYVIVGRKT
jgi:2-polyprenyl-3-methyl-5-hydroxy-6-metoxy-1,4-benzoquinol methylase